MRAKTPAPKGLCSLSAGTLAPRSLGLTAQVEKVEEILPLALEETVSTLRGKLGDDMEKWQWGRLHQTTFTHLFSRMKPLHLLFDLVNSLPR